jgi:hypothetical protein
LYHCCSNPNKITNLFLVLTGSFDLNGCVISTYHFFYINYWVLGADEDAKIPLPKKKRKSKKKCSQHEKEDKTARFDIGLLEVYFCFFNENHNVSNDYLGK